MAEQEQRIPAHPPESEGSEQLASSPMGPPSSTGSRKPKKPPPITPKRFNRFFTPRSSTGQRGASVSGKSGRQLRDITKNASNRLIGAQSATSSSTSKSILFDDIPTRYDNESSQTPHIGSSKKRKGLLSPESSPIPPSPSKKPRCDNASPHQGIHIIHEDDFRQSSSIESSLEPEDVAFPRPIRKVNGLGSAGRILQRSFGGFNGLGRGYRVDHCSDGCRQTRDFYTGQDDCHIYSDKQLPFCVASCNTNSLVAIGDEEGSINVIETRPDEDALVIQSHVIFRPHQNAVMDMAFSSDDYVLATASGDQSCRVIDMLTQTTKYVLAGHTSSVKQIRFQPGNNNVLASSSRDGSVQLWDLRCRGTDGPTIDVHVPLGLGSTNPPVYNETRATYANIYNSIVGAHTDRQVTTSTLSSSTLNNAQSRDNGTKGELTTRRSGEVSITALSFLPVGREHLLLTASEASTSIKVWDIRGRYSSRRGGPVPISTTHQPESHSRHRQFGINSLALSSDTARLYALSRDSTVYAYATNHLILGQAPEFGPDRNRRHRYGGVGESKEGLGPLYGFRHPLFHATTFYVKASLRPAREDCPELLAVGSSDGCPVLFPTDERMFPQTDGDDDDREPRVPTVGGWPIPPRRTASAAGLGPASRLEDTIPIYHHGTPLVHGHVKEVTSSAWTHGGELVTVGDDYLVRCWRQDGAKAEKLRRAGQTGEGAMVRWGCGWAQGGEGGAGLGEDGEDEEV
ncbi:WD40-repeat-containing domain protein [Lineolata rhizophorae]|uniref:WD40-repeat-containing domain protein n=1 Tax=Lineolata rhizophorae TaxID=578093 RepID=A0A6A6NQJ4_9PEZI|nr:WD40-repeat-containing domain protein [Lineolata rhizophorae]